MTVVLGLRAPGGVVIGADSSASNGLEVSVHGDPKAFFRAPYAVGFTTSWRMGQLLRYGPRWPSPDPGADLHAFMATTFVDAVRANLREGGWLKVEDGREEGGDFLVAYRATLFSFYSDFSVEEPSGPVAAIGSGWQYALGSATALLEAVPDSPREEVLARSLRVAAQLQPDLRPPFTLISTAPDRP